jgi:hypothetical protein
VDTPVIVGIAVASALFLTWVFTLFMLVLDSIPVGAKLVWFVALTLLAPITMPLYLLLRHRRLDTAR